MILFGNKTASPNKLDLIWEVRLFGQEVILFGQKLYGTQATSEFQVILFGQKLSLNEVRSVGMAK